MAITKIITVKRRLDISIDYAINPEKTAGGLDEALEYIMDGGKTEQQLFVSSINCRAETTFEDMQATKRRWKKTDRANKGYHIIQGFAPGEITPELAHKLGQEFAQRLLGDKYEVIVSTHLDKGAAGKYHNHIVFNSVSFLDGSMYRSTYSSYYDRIRGLSDELCREYGLSVIEPQGRGKHYAEWKAEKTGKPTFRNTIKEDVDRLIAKSYTFKVFVKNMEKAGYKVIYGQKHMKVLPPGGERYLRLSSLKDPRYTEQGIRERILRQQEKGELATNALGKSQGAKDRPQSRCKYRGNFKKHKTIKLRGFRALYFRYLYMLGKIKKKRHPTRKSRYMIAELQRFDRTVSQFKFLYKYGIETASDLRGCRDMLSSQIDTLAERRRPLSGLRKEAASEEEKQYISQEIAELYAQLRDLRRERKLCSEIEVGYPHIQTQLQETKIKAIEPEKEIQYEHRSRNCG